MRRLPLVALLAMAACGPKSGSTTPKDNLDADSRSGPDQKRSSAQKLDLNKPHTDEVSYQNQDRTDWYQVELDGRPGVLTTLINWDNVNSDLNIDVFDAFGAQIAASPVRGKGEKQKKLYTQIDKTGTYYIRVTAPSKVDGSVYTMEAQWQEPPAVAVTAPPPPPPPREEPPPPPEEKPKAHRVREPREPREQPAGEIDRGARGVRVSRGLGADDVHRQGIVGGHQAGRLGRGAGGRGRRRSARRRRLPGGQGDRREQVRRLGDAAIARQEQPRRDHVEPLREW